MLAEGSGERLAKGARFSESFSCMTGSSFVPKGVYRFRTQDDANRHWMDCLAQGMARIALQRR
jgi:hypothetical protein